MSTRVDAQSIKERVGLVDLAGGDVPLHREGHELHGPCPFCSCTSSERRHRCNRFRLNANGDRWFCRTCQPNGGDAISYVIRRDGLTFSAACRVLGASWSELGEPTRAQRQMAAIAEPPLFAEDLEPTDAWRERAHAFVQQCEALLWTDVGARAREYLKGRGLQPETVRAWCIGFHDADRHEPPGAWGLSDLANDHKPKRIWLPRGITIPWYIGEQLWMVKVRRATDDPKYWAIRGGHPLLFGANTLVSRQPAVMFEGEFDTLLGWQAAHDRTATVSLGAAGQRPTPRAALLLAGAVPLLAAYDADPSGDRGVAMLQKLAPRIRRIRPSMGKDISDFVAAGGRPRAWITFELARAALASRTAP